MSRVITRPPDSDDADVKAIMNAGLKHVGLPGASEEAERCLEEAFEDLRHATDAKGLRIMLRPASTSAADCRQKLEEHLRFFNGARFGGQPGELAYARNLQLLLNAWIAAIKFEIEVSKHEH